MSEKITVECEYHGNFLLPSKDVVVVDISNHTCNYRFSCPEDNKTILSKIIPEAGEKLLKRGCEHEVISEPVVSTVPNGGPMLAESKISENELSDFLIDLHTKEDIIGSTG